MMAPRRCSSLALSMLRDGARSKAWCRRSARRAGCVQIRVVLRRRCSSQGIQPCSVAAPCIARGSFEYLPVFLTGGTRREHSTAADAMGHACVGSSDEHIVEPVSVEGCDERDMGADRRARIAPGAKGPRRRSGDFRSMTAVDRDISRGAQRFAVVRRAVVERGIDRRVEASVARCAIVVTVRGPRSSSSKLSLSRRRASARGACPRSRRSYAARRSGARATARSHAAVRPWRS
jgi:hypothetical protein